MGRPFARSLGRGYLPFLLAVAGLALLPSIALSAIPPAGQVITSRSLALYDLGGQHLSAFSNEVSLSVLAVHGPVVTPDGTVDAPGRIVRAQITGADRPCAGQFLRFID